MVAFPVQQGAYAAIPAPQPTQHNVQLAAPIAIPAQQSAPVSIPVQQPALFAIHAHQPPHNVMQVKAEAPEAHSDDNVEDPYEIALDDSVDVPIVHDGGYHKHSSSTSNLFL